jgi:hypothetical protein
MVVGACSSSVRPVVPGSSRQGPQFNAPSAVTRRVRLAPRFIVVLVLSGCRGTPLPPLTPQVVSTAPYRQEQEAIVADPGAQQTIYRAVLHFYRPGPGQSRWLDRHLLPSAQGDAGRLLDALLTDRLVELLGKGSFCVLGSSACAHQRGGIVRLSLPYATGPDVARVMVRFDGRDEPYAPGFTSTEVFLLVRVRGKWKIHAHESAGVGSDGSGVLHKARRSSRRGTRS